MHSKKLLLTLLFLIVLSACTAAEATVPAAPAATPIPPADTAVPPTDTAVLPTDTAVSPTDTAVSPTDTAESPTDTPPPADTPEPETALEPGDPQHGREIFFNGGEDEAYQAKFACVTSHSIDGTVSGEDSSGPSLLGVAGRAAERVPGLSAEEYIRQSIVDPGTFLAPTYTNKMTKLGGKYLSAQELDDLIAYLLTLSGAAAPESDISPTPEVHVDLAMAVEEGNAARGRQLPAVAYRCTACHANEEMTGYGPPFWSTDDLPPIWERGEMRIADPGYEGQAATNQEYILESIFLPAVYIVPGEWQEMMPNAFHSYISDQQLADMLAWMETFE